MKDGGFPSNIFHSYNNNMLDIMPSCSTFYSHNSSFMILFLKSLMYTDSLMPQGLPASSWPLTKPVVTESTGQHTWYLQAERLCHEEPGWVSVFLGVKSPLRKVNELYSHPTPQVIFSGLLMEHTPTFNGLSQNNLFLVIEYWYLRVITPTPPPPMKNTHTHRYKHSGLGLCLKKVILREWD